MKALIVADSLSMPRKGIPYDDTWPSILNCIRKDIHWIQRSQRALNSNHIVGSLKEDYLEYYRPDIVILQIGIVDCAPRLFPSDSLIPKIINRFPVRIQNICWEYIKNNRKRSAAYAEVSCDKFILNIKSYVKRCLNENVSRVILIDIAEPVGDMLQKNPTIIDQVKRYNNRLHELPNEFPVVSIISLNEVDVENRHLFFASDGYHLSRNGALQIATLLTSNLTGKYI